jgi:hypothetical protein
MTKNGFTYKRPVHPINEIQHKKAVIIRVIPDMLGASQTSIEQDITIQAGLILGQISKLFDCSYVPFSFLLCHGYTSLKWLSDSQTLLSLSSG